MAGLAAWARPLGAVGLVRARPLGAAVSAPAQFARVEPPSFDRPSLRRHLPYGRTRNNPNYARTRPPPATLHPLDDPRSPGLRRYMGHYPHSSHPGTGGRCPTLRLWHDRDTI